MPPNSPGHTKIPSTTTTIPAKSHNQGFPHQGRDRRPRVAQRRGEVRLRELAAAAEHFLRRRSLAEDEEEADAERDGNDERECDEDQLAQVHGPRLQGDV